MYKRIGIVGLMAGVGVLAAFAEADVEVDPNDPPPSGVEQLLPRGRIAAVFEPVFVPAAEAEIPDEAWILGVVLEGESKAYSLNLLNRHEVVNDRSGDTAFAAVW